MLPPEVAVWLERVAAVFERYPAPAMTAAIGCRLTISWALVRPYSGQ
jgi:hypothetical protein